MNQRISSYCVLIWKYIKASQVIIYMMWFSNACFPLLKDLRREESPPFIMFTVTYMHIHTFSYVNGHTWEKTRKRGVKENLSMISRRQKVQRLEILKAYANREFVGFSPWIQFYKQCTTFWSDLLSSYFTSGCYNCNINAPITN